MTDPDAGDAKDTSVAEQELLIEAAPAVAISDDVADLRHICDFYWETAPDEELQAYREFVADALAPIEYADLNAKIDLPRLPAGVHLVLLLTGLATARNSYWYHFAIAKLLGSTAGKSRQLKVYELVHLLAIGEDSPSKPAFAPSRLAMYDAFRTLSEFDRDRAYVQFAVQSNTSASQIEPPPGLFPRFEQLGTAQAREVDLEIAARRLNVTVDSPDRVQIDNVVGVELLRHMPRQSVDLKPPRGEHYQLRPRTLPQGGFDVYAIPDATVAWDNSVPGAGKLHVIDSLGRLISPLHFGHNLERTQPLRKIPGRTAMLEDRFPTFNICHFWLDKYPRLALAKQLDPSIEQVLLLTHNSYLDYFLAQAGVHNVQDTTLKKGELQFEELLVVGSSFVSHHHPMDHGSQWAVDVLSELRPAVPPQPQRRVYISRDRQKLRRLTNETSMSSLLEKYGFETVFAEAISPAEQQELFSATTVMMSLHGAGLTNLIFMPAGSTVIELLPPLSASQSYVVSAMALGHEYVPVMCADPGVDGIADYSTYTGSSAQNARDVSIDLDLLESVLSEL